MPIVPFLHFLILIHRGQMQKLRLNLKKAVFHPLAPWGLHNHMQWRRLLQRKVLSQPHPMNPGLSQKWGLIICQGCLKRNAFLKDLQISTLTRDNLRWKMKWKSCGNFLTYSTWQRCWNGGTKQVLNAEFYSRMERSNLINGRFHLMKIWSNCLKICSNFNLSIPGSLYTITALISEENIRKVRNIFVSKTS